MKRSQLEEEQSASRLLNETNSCVATQFPFFSLLRHFAFASDFVARLMRNRRDSVRLVTLNITSPERINWVPISLMTLHAEESLLHCRVESLKAGRKTADISAHQQEGMKLCRPIYFNGN
jgi:hypothetical protein